jgi:gliding motility-associated-like protein
VAENPTFTSTQSSIITVNSDLNGCAGDPYSFGIDVKIKPVLDTIIDYTYCGNVQTPPIPLSGTPGATFNWDHNNPSIASPSLTFNPTAPDGSGTLPGFIPGFLTNNTYANNVASAIDQDVTFTVTPVLNGCSGNSRQFTITVNPIIDMVLFPNDTALCLGTDFNQVCFHQSGLSGLTYQWQYGNTALGMPTNGTDCIPTWTSLLPGSANLQVTPMLNQCAGISRNLNVTVVPRPIMDPIQDYEYCHGETTSQISFTSNLIPTTYFWNRSGAIIGSPDSGSDPFIPSFIADNPYAPGNDLCSDFTIYPFYNSNNITCPGDSQVVTICVHPLPIINAGNDTTLCIDQCLILNATGIGEGNINYVWDNGGVQSQPYCPTATINLEVIGSDANQCVNTDNLIINFINSNPPNINAGEDTAICLGNSFTFSATGDLGTTFEWNGGNYVNGQVITPTPAPQIDTFIVVGTLNQCVSRDSIILTVNPLPIVSITTLDSVLCEGETAVLTANGALNYQWTDGPSTAVYTFPALSGVYEVIGYDINGCSDTDDIEVVVNPLPNVLFSSNMNYGGCLEFCPWLTDLSTPPSASVQWDFGNNTFSTSVADSVQACYNSYGCYDITLTSTTAEGCSATLTQQNYICVNEIVASFEPNVDEQLISDPCFEFLNNSINATSYEWDFGDREESELVHTNHCYDSVGCYQVVLTAYTQDGCSDTSVQVVCVKDQVIIYVPNSFTPNGNGLNEVFLPILTAGYKPGTYEFNIYNRWGERIFTTQDKEEGWDGTYLGNEAQIGTYTYTIRFKDSQTNEIYTYSGRVSLIR